MRPAPGCAVVVAGRRLQPLEDVAAEIIAGGGKAVAVACDVGCVEASGCTKLVSCGRVAGASLLCRSCVRACVCVQGERGEP